MAKNSFWNVFARSDSNSVRTTVAPVAPETRAPTAPTLPDPTTTVTVDQALGLSLVYRATQIISGHVARMKLQTWKNGELIKSPALIRQPNIDMTVGRFLEETTVSLVLTGNAYWLLDRSEVTAPVNNITILNPRKVFVVWEDGRKYFAYEDKKYRDWQIKHLKLLSYPEADYGLGPIQQAQLELAGYFQGVKYANAAVATGDSPHLVLSFDAYMTKDELVQSVDDFRAQNDGGIKAVGQGAKVVPLYLNPADIQFIESQKFNVTRIATLFGLPAHMLAAEVNGNSMTYTNVEQANLEYLSTTLENYMDEISNALTDLTARGQEVKFNTDDLLRTDKNTVFAMYNSLIDKGVLTAEQVKQILIKGGFIDAG